MQGSKMRKLKSQDCPMSPQSYGWANYVTEVTSFAQACSFLKPHQPKEKRLCLQKNMRSSRLLKVLDEALRKGKRSPSANM